jgi:hypothetical protein
VKGKRSHDAPPSPRPRIHINETEAKFIMSLLNEALKTMPSGTLAHILVIRAVHNIIFCLNRRRRKGRVK